MIGNDWDKNDWDTLQLSELFHLLKETAPDLSSLVNRASMLEDTIAKEEAQIASLNAELAREEARIALIKAELASRASSVSSLRRRLDSSNDMEARRRVNAWR